MGDLLFKSISQNEILTKKKISESLYQLQTGWWWLVGWTFFYYASNILWRSAVSYFNGESRMGPPRTLT